MNMGKIEKGNRKLEDLMELRFRCRRCHSQEDISIFFLGITGTMTKSWSICTDCGNTIESLSPEHPDYHLLAERGFEHPKHIKIEIFKDDITIKVVKNHWYSKARDKRKANTMLARKVK